MASRGAETGPIPNVFAEAVFVMDVKTGLALLEKNADEKRPVASTQKLLTALIVSEAGGLDEPVVVESADLRVAPSRVGIKTGGEYARSLLLQTLLVKSGNDVACCLARDNAGGQEDFQLAMNARALQLGMKDSHFVNPHGLPADEQYSTARDMAKLAFVAYRDKNIRQAVTMTELELAHKGWVQKLTNTNRLLGRLPFVTGMKTGFTNAAGRCLISSGTYDDREVIAVVLGSDSKHIWDDSEALLRWALRIPEEDPLVSEDDSEVEETKKASS